MARFLIPPLFLCCCLIRGQQSAIKGPGQQTEPAPAPDFSASIVRGGVFQLSQHHGRTVLLAFLQTQPDRSATNPSRAFVPSLLSMDRQYRNLGLDVVIVDATAQASPASTRGNTSTMEALLNTTYDWNLTAPMLTDPGGKIARAFDVQRIPALVLISPRGQIVRRWTSLPHPGNLAASIQQLVGGPMKNRQPDE